MSSRNKSKYLLPSDLNGNNVPYKGKRFWVIEIEKDRPYDFINKEMADFAVWDKVYGNVTALLTKKPRRKFVVSLMSHVALEYGADVIRDAVRIADREFENYMKAIWK